MRCPSCGNEFEPDYTEGELRCPRCGAQFDEPDFEDEDEEETEHLKYIKNDTGLHIYRIAWFQNQSPAWIQLNNNQNK